MKLNIKNSIISLGVMVALFSLISVTTFAGGIYNADGNISDEISWDSDVIDAILSVIDNSKPVKTKCEVLIYNENFELVRFGSDECEFIKKIICRSDFLTEIEGIKYYRLNNQ